MGSKGVGKGLDDESLDPVWDILSQKGLVVFLHPHYGINSEAWGEKDNGHVLPLALGFPFETTIVGLALFKSCLCLRTGFATPGCHTYDTLRGI